MMNLNTDAASPENVSLHDSLKRWRAQVDRDLKGAPFENRLVTQTIEGIALQPLYTRADLANRVGAVDMPGQVPFRRGRKFNSTEGSCRRLQPIYRPDGTSFNQALLRALMGGQNAVVFPERNLAKGIWSPYSIADFKVALKGVEISAVSLHFETTVAAASLAASLEGFVVGAGIDAKTITGSLAMDPMRDILGSQNFAGTNDGMMDELTGWQMAIKSTFPTMRSIGVDAGFWNDAGAHAGQEIAFALAMTKQIIENLAERGIKSESVMASLLVRFATGPQFFMEMAKFRAWRVVLSKLLVALEIDPKEAGQAEVHARSSRWNKTRLDPHVNMLRLTTEALAAGLGGVDGLHIGRFDRDSGCESELSERVARNLHVLFFEEFGFTHPQDAVGGSFYVESLTDQLARKAWDIFREIESHGGMFRALKEGWPQAQVAATVKERKQAFATRKNGLIGTNLFPNPKDQMEVNPSAEAGASAPRDGTEEGTRSIAPVPAYRAAEVFEQLRLTAASIEANRGSPPTAYLAKMGSIKEYKARAEFSAEFMAVGGFKIREGTDPIEAKADVVVICSTDENYETLVPQWAPEIKRVNPNQKVILAGLPRDPEVVQKFREAGIDEFIHGRANLPEVLSNLLKPLGSNI